MPIIPASRSKTNLSCPDNILNAWQVLPSRLVNTYVTSMPKIMQKNDKVKDKKLYGYSLVVGYTWMLCDQQKKFIIFVSGVRLLQDRTPVGRIPLLSKWQTLPNAILQ